MFFSTSLMFLMRGDSKAEFIIGRARPSIVFIRWCPGFPSNLTYTWGLAPYPPNRLDAPVPNLFSVKASGVAILQESRIEADLGSSRVGLPMFEWCV